MDLSVIRAEQLWQQAGAYSVRIQGMARQHHIHPEKEFDEHDGPDTKYIVLMDDVYPIATCRFYETDASTVVIGRVVVLPEYRGRGLGRRTIEEAEAWIEALGYSAIRLESRIGKTAFYEKLGYCCLNGEVLRGDTFDCVRMEKRIGAER